MKFKLPIMLGTYLCFTAFANTADPEGRTAIFKSFELVPNQKLTLNLEINRRCSDLNKEQVTIEDFESSKEYPSVDSGKNKQVRVKHYYTETFSPCQNDFVGKYSKQITIGPFKEKMTHIKITTTDNIRVNSL
jgi:hypothetical protein